MGKLSGQLLASEIKLFCYRQTSDPESVTRAGLQPDLTWFQLRCQAMTAGITAPCYIKCTFSVSRCRIRLPCWCREHVNCQFRDAHTVGDKKKGEETCVFQASNYIHYSGIIKIGGSVIWEAYQRELGSIPGKNLLSLSLAAAFNQERPEQNAEEERSRDVLPPSADYYSSAKNNPAVQ